LVDFTPPGSTIKAAACQKTIKTQGGYLAQETRLLTKGLGVLSLHNNAEPHNAATTANFLNSWGWEILPHPPYSSDLAPSDFHLFPKMKKQQCFHSNEDVQNEVTKWLRAQDAFFL
jgi:transposase